MVTAHELREITRNYELVQLLDRLKNRAKTGECIYSVDNLHYLHEKQLERLGVTIHYHDEDEGRTITR